MPGHHYTGPGNPLDEQLKYDPKLVKFLRYMKSQQVELMLLVCNMM